MLAYCIRLDLAQYEGEMEPLPRLQLAAPDLEIPLVIASSAAAGFGFVELAEALDAVLRATLDFFLAAILRALGCQK